MDTFYKIIELIENSSTVSDIIDTSNNALENYNKPYAIEILKSGGIYGRTFDKYILLKYEYSHFDETVEVSNYSNLSIEYVLPQTQSENGKWVKDFNEDERAFWTHNIANLILISGRKNSQLSNSEFCR